MSNVAVASDSLQNVAAARSQLAAHSRGAQGVAGRFRGSRGQAGQEAWCEGEEVVCVRPHGTARVCDLGKVGRSLHHSPLQSIARYIGPLH